MTTFDSFAAYVRDALAHLYDRIYIRSHPLTSLLVDRTDGNSADDLRLLLLDAIEQLRPPAPCPPSAQAWRPYRYLMMRYVEGAKPEAVARELQISVRQSRREHDHALAGVTAHLWDEYQRRGGGDEVTRHSEASPRSEPPSPRGGRSVKVELARIGGDEPPEPVSVRETLDDAVDIASQLLAQRNVQLEVSLPEDLPLVRFHRQVMRQALLDLLTCAAECLPKPSIAVSAEVRGGSVLVSLRVPTIGAVRPSRTLEERLRQTRALVDLHHGRLVVGVHSCDAFSAELFLPLASPRCLLVVDDNPDVAYLFSRYLRDEGFQVIQASTGEMAAQLARDSRPDAITLDVLMPAEDGWDTLRRLTRNPDTRGIPVIVCSVLPERSLAMSLGVAGFLDKPVKRQELIDVLRACLTPRH